jgi:4-diphosphocytidyl-2-C-methyl-D-erythritol kinase
MVAFPPCKINLGLHVIRKRPDGYHALETCFYPVPWTDILEIIPSEQLVFTASGNIIPGKEEDNLCLKAYHLLQADFNLPPVKIHLHKIIPTGAGLGGGSSDAAHTLRLLNRIFGLGLSDEKLMAYAANLGSDCAFFIQDKPMLGTGRGEILQPLSLSLKGKYLVLIKPDIHVSTAEAYGGIVPREPSRSLRTLLTDASFPEWKNSLVNDFEETVFRKHPAIADVKEMLYRHGARYACMSGSGATVLGLFDEPVSLPVKTGYDFWAGTLPV